MTAQWVRETDPRAAIEAYEREILLTRVEAVGPDPSSEVVSVTGDDEQPASELHSVLDEWKIKSAARPLPWHAHPDD